MLSNSDFEEVGSSKGEFQGLLNRNNDNIAENGDDVNGESSANDNNSNNNNNNNNNIGSGVGGIISSLIQHGSNLLNSPSNENEKEKYLNSNDTNSNNNNDNNNDNSNNGNNNNNGNNKGKLTKKALYKLEEEEEETCSSGGEQSSLNNIILNNSNKISEKKKTTSFLKNKNLENGIDDSSGDDYDNIDGIPLPLLSNCLSNDDENNIKNESMDTCKNSDHLHYSAHEEKTHNNYQLTSYDKIPPYLQGNEFIVSGYRVNFSYKLCLKSIFRLHNETLNIWTHLFGTFLFLALMIYTLNSRLREDATSVDKFVFCMFFICAQAQMLFSATFHTFCSVSGKVYLWMARLDYSGISLMIVGSHFPPIYYLFEKCHPTSGLFYLILISCMGIVGVIVGMIPIFQTYSFRTFRTVFFIVFGLFILIPLPQICAQMGFTFIWPLLSRLIIMGSLYIFGAIIYATRYPECCCRPGSLDKGFSSHVIWHCFVIAGAVMSFFNCLYAYDHYSGPNASECPL
ncbi:hypothetical protein ACTA71_003659 [Dictyostelium dimigraforme]